MVEPEVSPSEPEEMAKEFADLFANPELLAQVDRGEAADRSSLIRRPSFAKHFRQ
jgi:hypothetical protein